MWVLQPAPEATKQYYTNTEISPNCKSLSSKLLSCRKRYRRGKTDAARTVATILK